MDFDAKKRISKKRRSVRKTTQMSQINCENDNDTAIHSHSNSLTQEVDAHQVQSAPANEVTQEDSPKDLNKCKRSRGLTKMKEIAMEPGRKIHVEFTSRGEPCGNGSVTLSSYLGPLVREHVPVTLHDWRKLDEDKKIVMWKSIQARFDLDQEWQKSVVFKSMGCVWRASKSRLVGQIQKARNEEERLALQPKNITSKAEWRKFVKEKTSPTFKVVSDKYKAIRRNQISHTCSRRGMARLREDMKKSSADPSSVSRVKVWIKAHTKKDGSAVNMKVSETIEKLKKIETESPSYSTTNVREDSLSKVLGPDKHGRLRGMGGAMTISKLNLFQAHDKYVMQMEDRIKQLETFVNTIGNDKIKQNEEGNKASSKGENPNLQRSCMLLDWCGTDEIVAEGCLLSTDPKELVDHIHLGPNAMKVSVDIINNPDAFLWRPAVNMTCIKEAQGKVIAWPAERVILEHEQESEEEDNISIPSPKSVNKCTLFDWCGKDEVVAEGRLHSSDPKQLVNNIPLGPNAMIVWVDVPICPEAFLWRPSLDMTLIKDAINSTIAWPANKVVLEKIPEREENVASPLSATTTNNINKRCGLLDVNGSGKIVAEGRWSSSDPDQLVHFVPLGPNATRVWVDTPKVPTAYLWRSTSEMELIEDAVGTTVAWPTDKVVMF